MKAESILTKVSITKRYGLNGIAIWRLGLVTGEMRDAGDFGRVVEDFCGNRNDTAGCESVDFGEEFQGGFASEGKVVSGGWWCHYTLIGPVRMCSRIS